MTARDRHRPAARFEPAPEGEPSPTPISVLVIDDDAPSRGSVLACLRTEPDVSIGGELGGGVDAIRAIEALCPDVVLLDVALSGLDGFQVIERAAPSRAPLVIFLTATERHAARAFDMHAIDYLLKPVVASRLREAIGRARWTLAVQAELRTRHDTLGHLVRTRSVHGQPSTEGVAPGERGYLKRFAVRDGNRFLLVNADQVDWLDSAANYVRLHVGPSAFLVRTTMNEIEQKLDPQKFARIHRSTIVNINRVKEVTPDWHGEFEVKLADGHSLRLTRTYRHRLLP